MHDTSFVQSNPRMSCTLDKHLYLQALMSILFHIPFGILAMPIIMRYVTLSWIMPIIVRSIESMDYPVWFSDSLTTLTLP